MPDFTENDLRDIERDRDLPPDQLYGTHRCCPDEDYDYRDAAARDLGDVSPAPNNPVTP